MLRTKQEILNYFKNRNIDKDYLQDHITRYIFLLRTVDNLISKIKYKNKLNILDIGPSFQTEILRMSLANNVDSIGFLDKRFKIRKQDKHFEHNLNNAQYKNKWVKLKKKYYLIVMAELIEHLYTSPVLVLNYVKRWLKKGGFLIIQTPNAISLNRRIKMLIGRHPYDMIRENNLNPGHFREYTLSELISIGKESGFILENYSIENYFKHKGVQGNINSVLSKLLPETLLDGITICFRKS